MRNYRQYPDPGRGLQRTGLPPVVPAIVTPAPAGPGLTRRGFSALFRYVRSELHRGKLDLLRADDLAPLREENEEELARRIGGLARWIGMPMTSRLGYGVRRVPPVQLGTVDAGDGLRKLRLVLTDEGVSALSRRCRATFETVGVREQSGAIVVKVRARFGDGAWRDRLGGCALDVPGASEKAEAAARKTLLYDELGILPLDRRLWQPVDMDFVTRDWVHNPRSADPLDAAVPDLLVSPAVDPLAAGTATDTRVVTGTIAAEQLSALREHLLRSGWTDDDEIATAVQKELALEAPRALEQLSYEEADLLLEVAELAFPARAQHIGSVA